MCLWLRLAVVEQIWFLGPGSLAKTQGGGEGPGAHMPSLSGAPLQPSGSSCTTQHSAFVAQASMQRRQLWGCLCLSHLPREVGPGRTPPACCHFCCVQAVVAASSCLHLVWLPKEVVGGAHSEGGAAEEGGSLVGRLQAAADALQGRLQQRCREAAGALSCLGASGTAGRLQQVGQAAAGAALHIQTGIDTCSHPWFSCLRPAYSDTQPSETPPHMHTVCCRQGIIAQRCHASGPGAGGTRTLHR